MGFSRGIKSCKACENRLDIQQTVATLTIMSESTHELPRVKKREKVNH